MKFLNPAALSAGSKIAMPFDVLCEWDFTRPTGGAGTLTANTTFSRAGIAGDTVQLGENSWTTVPNAAGQPKYGRPLNALPFMLCMEEARTNGIAYARDFAQLSAWTPFGSITPTTGRPDAAGGTGATRITAASGTNGLGETTALPMTTAACVSAWVKSNNSSGPNTNLFATTAGRLATTANPGAVWQRVSVARSIGSDNVALVPLDGRDWSGIGGLVAGARDVDIDLAMREAGLFPTSAIITAGGATSRAANLCGMSSRYMLDSSRFGVEIVLYPMAARGQYSGAVTVVDHLNCNVTVSQTTGAVTVKVGGNTYTTAGTITWAANDLVEIWVEFGGGVLPTAVKARINGGVVVTLSTGSPPTQPALITSGSSFTICSNIFGAGISFSAWVRRVRTYRAGRRPLWAA